MYFHLHVGSVEELHQIFSAFQSKVMEKEKTLREVNHLQHFMDFSIVNVQLIACIIFKMILNLSVSLCPKHCFLNCLRIVN